MHKSDPIDVFMQLVFMIIIGYVAIDTLIKYAFFEAALLIILFVLAVYCRTSLHRDILNSASRWAERKAKDLLKASKK